jgi:hypothetical protein
VTHETTISFDIDKDIVVVRGDSPVLGVVILLRVVFLVVGKECVEGNALFEVFSSFKAADVFQEVEITVCVDASFNKSVPMDALQFHVGMIFLEAEVHKLSKVDVGALDSVHVLTRHFKLIEVEVFRENLHLNYLL